MKLIANYPTPSGPRQLITVTVPEAEHPITLLDVPASAPVPEDLVVVDHEIDTDDEAWGVPRRGRGRATCARDRGARVDEDHVVAGTAKGATRLRRILDGYRLAAQKADLVEPGRAPHAPPTSTSPGPSRSPA